MRDLTDYEINSVDGSGIIYDLAYTAGETVAGWFNAAQERIYNDPFRRYYHVK